MKRILIVLLLVGVIKISAGSEPSANSMKLGEGMKVDVITKLFVPTFTELDGNIFIAIKAKEQLKIEDGDVVEFEFAKKVKLYSFHINDINQELINTGQADLFVMVHHELALMLKSHRVERIHVNHNGVIHTIQVNRFWIPDEHLDS